MFSLVSDEILNEVLTFVPPLDLLCNVNQVCIRFHTIISEDDTFWPNLAEELHTSLSSSKRRRRRNNNNMIHDYHHDHVEDNGNNNHHHDDENNSIDENNADTDTTKSAVIVYTDDDTNDDDENAAAAASTTYNWPLPSWINEDEDDEEEEGDDLLLLSKHQYQRLCIFVESYNKNYHRTNPQPPIFLDVGNLLRCKEIAKSIRSRSRGYLRTCLASTTDNSTELIENVLLSSEVPVRSSPSPLPGDNNDDNTQLLHNWNSLPIQNDEDDNARILHFLRGNNNNTSSSGTGGWWSSQPSVTKFESKECIGFCTKYKTCLLLEITIKALRDPFLSINRLLHNNNDAVVPIYTWQYTTIRIYNLGIDKLFSTSSTSSRARRGGGDGDDDNNCNNGNDDDDDEEEDESSNNPFGFKTMPCVMEGKLDDFINNNDGNGRNNNNTNDWSSDNDILQNLLVDEEPVYESRCGEHEQRLIGPMDDNWIRYILPDGGIIGNFVTITIEGKNSRQYETTGYYVCIEKLFIRGIPLYEK